MPFQPGHPRFGGRKPGAKGKLTAAREEAILQSGLSPIAFLTEVYRNPENPLSLRVDAAGRVCQFIYPKLQSVDMHGGAGQPLVVNVLRFSDDRPDQRQLPTAGPIIEMASEAVIDAVAPVVAALDDEDDETGC